MLNPAKRERFQELRRREDEGAPAPEEQGELSATCARWPRRARQLGEEYP
jgi:hypothetical protein